MIIDKIEEKVRPAVEFFTAPSFREGQREAIEKIDSAFLMGYKYVILDAPTGLGKSYIAKTFADQIQSVGGSSHILTVQKILQDQYDRDFSDSMFVMKGRSAYNCIAEPVSCSKGLCKRKKDVPCKPECPYKFALIKAAESPTTVHNFDSFYYQGHLAGRFKARDLMVVDEAHQIENKFLNFAEFVISNKGKSNLSIPKLNTVNAYSDFLKEQYGVMRRRFDILAEVKDLGVGLTLDELKEYDQLQMILKKLQTFFRVKDSVEYVFDYAEFSSWETVTFKPVMVGDFVVKRLIPYADKFLFMSATILDKNIFCRSIGINPSEAKYIRVENTFPVNNRPILRKYAGSMSFKNIENNLPKAMDKIREILAKYPDIRGIIHTVSKRIAQHIKTHLKDPRLTFKMDFYNVNDMLDAHKKKPNSIIVASGLKEGLDLYDDLSRLQILVKVPYPNLADKRIMRRKEIDPSWYGYMTVLMFIQSLGRSVRSKTDSAKTYLLDSDFGWFRKQNSKLIPSYVKSAFVRKK